MGLDDEQGAIPAFFWPDRCCRFGKKRSWQQRCTPAIRCDRVLQRTTKASLNQAISTT